MRNLKRALSLALAAVMVLGLMIVGAGAADVYDNFTDKDEIDHAEAVQTMVALNVIAGKEDGSFYDPTGTLTRAEMAKIVSYVMNGGVEPVMAIKPVPTYSDIDGHWAESYIEYCTSMNIIAGDGAGRFNPEGTLTASQTAKMFLTAMGYNANVFGFTGTNWEVNTNRYANEAGLYKELGDVSPSDPISRDDAAQMAYNAIQATMMKRTWSQDLETGKLTETYAPWMVEDATTGASFGWSLLNEKFDGTIRVGYMNHFTYDEAKGQWTYTFNSTNANSNQVFGGKSLTAQNRIADGTTLKSTEDYTGFFGMQVKVIYNVEDNEIIYGIYANDSSVVAEGGTGNVEDYNDDADNVTVSGTDYKLNADADTIPVYNFGDNGGSKGTLDSLKPADDGTNLSAYTFKLVDNTGDGKIDAVIRTPMTVAKINYVGKDTVQFSNGIIAQDIDDLEAYEDYAAGDWVYFIRGVNSVTEKNTIVKAELKTAAVSGVRGGDAADDYTEYQIDGAWLASTKDGTYTAGIANADVNDTIEYVSLGSTIFYAKIVDIAATSKNIALVITAGTNNSTSSDVTGSSAEAKLLMPDGAKTVVTLSKVNGEDDNLAGDAADLIGTLVTYRTDSSGDYELMSVDADNKAGYEDFVDAAAAGTKAGYIDGEVNGYELADDAVVYFYGQDTLTASSSNKAELYTAKELKNTWGSKDKSSLTNAGKTVVLTQEINGFTYARVVLLIDADLLNVTTGSNYGYLAAPTSRTVEDGETYLNYTIQTADGVIEVREKNTDAANLYPQGAVITYDTVSDTEVENVNLVNDIVTGMVTGWDGSSKIALDGTTTEVNDDTTVIYVDSAKKVGAEGGTIQKAADTNGDGTPDMDNVRYVLSANYVVLLVVDINNDMQPNPAAGLMTVSAEDAAGLADALASDAGTVKVTGTLAANTKVTVPAGKTLVVSKDQTNGGLEVTVSDGATLEVADGLNVADGTKIIAQPGATVEFAGGSKEVIGENSLSSTGAITVATLTGGRLKYTLTADAVLSGTLEIAGTDELAGNFKITGTNGAVIKVYNSSTGNKEWDFDTVASSTATSTSAGTWTAGKAYTWTVTTGDPSVSGWLESSI